MSNFPEFPPKASAPKWLLGEVIVTVVVAAMVVAAVVFLLVRHV